MRPESRGDSNRQALRALAALLVLGVVLQLWLVSRAWIGGDQVLLLDLGLRFLETGKLEPTAKTMSGGASIPGSLLQLLIAAPLRVWPDNRAPGVLIALFHLGAVLVLARTLWRSAGSRVTVIFTAVYWLSPWRLYHSGFVWEPAYIFLPAALHLWACARLRAERAWFPSAVLAATLVATVQLHGSFVILVLSTLLLTLGRSIRLDWRGAFLGALIASLTLIPTAIAWVEGRLPASATGTIGYGLVQVYPVVKALFYWFRLGSLDTGGFKESLPIGEESPDAGPAALTVEAGARLALAIASLSVLVPVFASLWTFRSKGAARVRDAGGWNEGEAWLRRYAGMTLVAVIAAAALSPVVIQGWHVVIALPAATIPVAMWIAHVWPPRATWLRWALVLFVVLRVPEALVIGAGHEIYRRERLTFPVSERVRTIIPERLRPIF